MSEPEARRPAAGPVRRSRDIGHARRGHHKVYVGMAAGVGKTYRALQELHELRARGVDAVVGLVESHGRADTAALAEGLEVLPRRVLDYRGVSLTDLELDGLLKRKPAVVLIDELAHTNVPGMRHPKRYEDVEEVLAAGIDVISTVNIQHLESVNDLVARLTGVRVKERVPDRILAEADQVQLVDVTPEQLRERLVAGKIYGHDRVEASLHGFFTLDNLTVLRELALRQVADTVEGGPLERDRPGVKERIAVAITPTPNATRLIRRGFRLAQRLDGEFFIVYVKDRPLTRSQEQVLDTHRVITGSLEGTFVRLENRDAARALIDFIAREGITQVVMGASLRNRWQELLHGSIINQVLNATEGVDVYVIGRDGGVVRKR